MLNYSIILCSSIRAVSESISEKKLSIYPYVRASFCPTLASFKIALNNRTNINKTFFRWFIDLIDIFADNRIADSSMQYGLSCECVAYRYNILFLYNFQHYPLMGRNFSRISFYFCKCIRCFGLAEGHLSETDHQSISWPCFCIIIYYCWKRFDPERH